MKGKWMLALAAATALMPAAAIAQDGAREGRRGDNGARAAWRADRERDSGVAIGARVERQQRGNFDRPQRNVERPVRPAFRNAERPAPQGGGDPAMRARIEAARQQQRDAYRGGQPSFRAERRDDRAGFRAERRDDRQDFRAERQRDRAAFGQERRDDRARWQGGGVDRQQFLRDRQADRQDFRNDRRDDRRDFRADRRDDRQDFRADRRDDRRDWNRGDRRDWNGRQRWVGGNDRNRGWNGGNWNNGGWNGGGWDRDWRRDRRYDWRGYRAANRSLYRLPRYYAPQGYYGGYRRFGIGFTLSSILFAQDYWIDDPWSYRLPDADGPYRWVRYYNDALLVDLETGEVVDVEYDIFW